MRRLLTAWTPWWVLLAVVLATLAAFAEGPIQNLWRPAVVVTAIVSMIVARRWNALPWLFVGLALIAAARMSLAETGSDSGFTAGHMSWQQAISDVVVGASLVSVLVLTLRSRRGTLGRRELLDGFTVAVGAGLATWLALANPGLDSGTNPVLAVGATAYFPAAIIVVTFCADLLFDGLGRNRAMWFAFAGAVANLAGAGIRALIQSDTIDESAHRLMLAAFIAGFVLFCAAISHPAAPEIFDPGAHRSELLSRPHRETVLMAPLLLSLGVPLVLVAIVAPTSDTDLVVRTIATVTLVAAIVARLYVALDASASAQRALVRRLNRDELTNLLTRPRFVKLVSEVLEVTWRSEHHPTLIQVNIDRFKNINDTLGHDSANRLLVALAERLRAAAETFDGTVSRAGGDDFVVLDDSTRTREDAEQRAERIKGVFAHPFTFGESVVFVTASIGVAMAPRNRTVSAEELMRRADIATHRAKADGRNRTVVFDDSMQSNLTHRMDVEHALHGAIGRQEMRLYYQPIVDIVSGHLSGFEALIRWRRGDGTILPPGDFIAIAEETGIINELGAWALNDALRQLRYWIDAGTVPTTTTISVNVSPRQIADPGFADVVRDALERTGISPHLLWLEMTESMMLDEPELAESTLRRIRATGVRLALDDFGTGYSSLSLLQQFPIQRIKIDRAFVQGIADHSNDRSLVRTIIAMAQSMGLDLVAEGVETVHQLQSLRDLGCDKAQGYLISRPVPADAMHTTMVALTELVDLSLFAVDQTRPGIEVPDRWLEHVSAGPMNPLGRQLATRPIG